VRRGFKEYTVQGLAPSGTVHRMIMTDNWKGYRRNVRAVFGCELLQEEPLNNDMRRLIFNVPALSPGQVHQFSWEWTVAFDEHAPFPTGGRSFADEINEDFIYKVAVMFGARKPARAWFFEDLPRMLVPDEPRPERLIGLDTEDRLVWNFFPPTNARNCYGVAWQF
jgi:hypothetical protein